MPPKHHQRQWACLDGGRRAYPANDMTFEIAFRHDFLVTTQRCHHSKKSLMTAATSPIAQECFPRKDNTAIGYDRLCFSSRAHICTYPQ